MYPKISFTSTYIEQLEDKKFALHGNLTIKDLTKHIDCFYNSIYREQCKSMGARRMGS
ncbi:hypothetical protein ACFTQ7_24075 [Lysinibacillus sp. NPDC056959]|uniref:hypothetical protein n=1 Tax=Lysinibacillus sp. NPDC056959 TaxID=3345981 RepID=UPI00363FEA00